MSADVIDLFPDSNPALEGAMAAVIPFPLQPIRELVARDPGDECGCGCNGGDDAA